MANGYARYNGLAGAGSGGGSGTVTSVGFADGSSTPIFTITGSPVTTSGTITETLTTQSANIVFAGPATGSAAQPTFRALVSGDLPAGTGTVTSVALALPGSLFSVSGSPVTTSGTLTGSLTTQTANFVFAGPTSGGAATPTFRALVAADIPSTITIGALDAQAANANGLALVSNVLSTQSADATHPGMINITTQSFAGNKTFTGNSTTLLRLGSADFTFDTTNQALGIGVQPGTNTFIDGVNSTGAAKRFVLTGYGTGSTVGTRGRFARGTSGTPAAVQNGDTLNFLSGQGYGTSQFPTASTGALNFVAGETFTNTSNLTYMTIQTTPTGSVTAAEVARFTSTGNTVGPQSSSTAIHQINGGLKVTTRTITGNLTIDTTTTDYIVFVTTGSGAISVTLPAPTVGRILILKDISGQANTNNITLVRNGSEQIEGIATSKLLTTNWGSWTITSDGTNWFFI